jgi:hypothetical protein
MYSQGASLPIWKTKTFSGCSVTNQPFLKVNLILGIRIFFMLLRRGRESPTWLIQMAHTGPHDSVCQCLHLWFTMPLKIIYTIHHTLQLLKFSTCSTTTLQHPCMPAGTVEGWNSDWVGKSRKNSAFNFQVDSSSEWWIQQTLHILITHLLFVPDLLSCLYNFNWAHYGCHPCFIL